MTLFIYSPVIIINDDDSNNHFYYYHYYYFRLADSRTGATH